MAKKQMTDEQLAEMGRMASTALQQLADMWSLGIKGMPIASSEYRLICSTGKKVQQTYYTLREMAYSRGWDTERIKQAFPINTGYGFS